MKLIRLLKRTQNILLCVAVMVMFVMIISSCGSEGHQTNSDEKDAKKGIEKIVASADNDNTKMYSRDERIFSFLAYPNGISEDDFIIDHNWDEYASISDVKLEERDDSTKISFKLTVDPSILQNSSKTMEMISIKSKDGKVSSDEIWIELQGVDISDAEPLTLKINEPQIATFKVIPASLPLDELKIGMNAYIGNLKAEIVDSDIDEDNNCQYVHVETSVDGKHNGLSSTSFSLTDIHQLKGGRCDITIVE